MLVASVQSLRLVLSNRLPGYRPRITLHPIQTLTSGYLFSSREIHVRRAQRKAMPSQFLPSIRDSETITCRRCNTRQYPRNGNCIACHHSLPLRYVKIDIDNLLSSCPQEQRNQIAHRVGRGVRILRKQRHISQSQLANLVANLDRSYLSRLEFGHVLLPVSKLLPLARALGLTAVILRFEELDPRKTSKSPGSG
jgi:ribosomal protein L40E